MRQAECGGTIGPSETLKAEVIHAVREEMAVKLADCVFRRTELGTAGDPGPQALETCAELMAGELRWSADRIASELAEVRAQFPLRHNKLGVKPGSGEAHENHEVI
jgi:glycerol-3-phosphate dehydrogenase